MQTVTDEEMEEKRFGGLVHIMVLNDRDLIESDFMVHIAISTRPITYLYYELSVKPENCEEKRSHP